MEWRNIDIGSSFEFFNRITTCKSPFEKDDVFHIFQQLTICTLMIKGSVFGNTALNKMHFFVQFHYFIRLAFSTFISSLARLL